MNSLLLVLIQAALVVLAGRYGKECVSTVTNSIRTRKFIWMHEPYRRSSAWQSVVLVGPILALAAILPLSGDVGFAITDGNVVTVIALFMLTAMIAGLVQMRSMTAMIACAMSGVMLALAIPSGSVNGGSILLAAAGSGTPATVLALIAFGAILMAFRVGSADEPGALRDGSVMLWSVLSVFFVRLLAPTMPTFGATTPTAPQFGIIAVCIAGSVVAVGLVSELLFWVWSRMNGKISARTLVKLSFALSFASIVSSVWMMS